MSFYRGSLPGSNASGATNISRGCRARAREGRRKADFAYLLRPCRKILKDKGSCEHNPQIAC